MDTALGTLTISPRFNGPIGSGNGGYVAGELAKYVDGIAEVTLRARPPLGRALAVVGSGDVVALRDGEVLIAEARVSAWSLELPRAPSLAQAEDCTTRYAGVGHRFTTCFVCGFDRAVGDGLRILSGPIEASAPGLLAAPWQIDASLADEHGQLDTAFVWAALDCPGYFAGAPGVSALLGRMSAQTLRMPKLGERCISVGWPLGREGRKAYAGTALFDADGGLYAFARQTWIIVDSY